MTSDERRSDNVLAPNGLAPTSPEVAGPLVADLAQIGIRYLAGQPVVDLVLRTQHPREVLAQIAQHEDPRLRATLVSLFLLHPTWASLVLEPRMGASAPAVPLETLSTSLLAARYLQEQWYFQLTVALGRTPQLPTAALAPLWRERALPAPWIGQGEPGLVALERAEQRRTGLPWAYAGDWQNQLDHLLRQERSTRQRTPGAPAPEQVTIPFPSLLPPLPPTGLPAHPLANRTSAGRRERREVRAVDSLPGGAVDDPVDDPVAWRPPITRATIAQFLRALGEDLLHPARLTLGTETSLVWWNIVPASAALDLALGWGAAAPAATVPTDEMERLLARDRARAPWEVEWPGLRIPLPSGWEQRAHRIGRFGLLEVSTCDPVSVALAALARGTSHDFITTLDLLTHRCCTLAQVTRGVHDLGPRWSHAHLVTTPDPDVMAVNLAAVQHWVQAHLPATPTPGATPGDALEVTER